MFHDFRHKLARRLALRRLFALALAACATPALANADAFPSKSIAVVVPMSPGGATDVLARLLAQHLTQALGQPVVVENKPGATGSIGAQHVARADPEGYTLLLAPSSVAVVNPLVSKVPYDFEHDFRPVGLLAHAETVLVASSASGLKSLDDVIRYAKQNPGKLKFGSNGQGGALHLGAEFLQQAAGIELTHIPYKGASQAETALASGEIDLMVTNTISAMPHIRAGRLVALAIASPGSSRELPQVPSASATLPGYAVDTWLGLYAPARTPDAVIARLNAATNAFLGEAATQEALRNRGFEPAPGTPAAALQFQRGEAAMWEKVVTQAKARGSLE